MFNDKTNKKRGKLTAVVAGAAVISMALTFGYATVADAQIKATVSKPALRTEYKETDMIDLSGVVNLYNGSQKISISLLDSDLKSALRMIADKAGLNVIFHNSVQGTVTLDLVNVTLNDEPCYESNSLYSRCFDVVSSYVEENKKDGKNLSAIA